MKTYILETARLKLRQYLPSDIDNVFELNSDPEVMKYVNMGKTLTRSEAQMNLNLSLEYYSRSKHFGLWAAEEKSTGDYVGWFSLKPLRGTTEVEVGYRLKRKYWGQGIATEGARAMVDRAFNTADLIEVCAIVHIENEASKRVLEKVGFALLKRGIYVNPLDNKLHDVDWFIQKSPHFKNFQMRRGHKEDLEEIAGFYKSRGYDHQIDAHDDFHSAWINNQIAGVVRLVEEQGTVVLRGMQVHPDFQKRGVGRVLLRQLDQAIGGRECYCIPYSHLQDFYGMIGFKTLEDKDAPNFLQERVQKYRQKSLNVIMKRDQKPS